MLLFVYGTLRTGGTNAHRMRGARSLGPARTLPEFQLYDGGWYPMMVAGARAIHGELVEVAAQLIAELDDFEEHPRWFRRTPIVLEGGQAAEAYLYVDALPPGARPIDGEDWLRYAP